ncbi:hypothetical protein SAMN04244553_3604 [Nocardia amikacinitolerans]|uniref:Uncharacterized protein n=1 Tax=Nocardia amikacinitolerans TaxID=756689 RepID=A0A285LIA8_9NOCA|nr:hypothetical protein [Nocardia amikacinitolerans]SNY84173.1 hypothetical protein SAMN04244553_3604 [Nocardia amikacinitolerans]
MIAVTPSQRPSFHQIWKRQTWGVQTLVIGAAILAGISTLNLVLWIGSGLAYGTWPYDAVRGSLGQIAFAWSYLGWIYWRTYAKELEHTVMRPRAT